MQERRQIFPVYLQQDARHAHKQLLKHEPDALLDDANDTLGAKLRLWRSRGVANVYVVGEKEAEKFAASGEVWAMRSEGRAQQPVRIDQ